MIDHIVYAAPDLEAACVDLEARLGVRPSPGGKHTGRGTHNALLDLGDGSYLEVIGPDPDQPAPARPRPFGIDTLALARLITWAAKASDIDDRVARAKAAGYDAGTVQAMSRMRPDGVNLAWKLTLRDEPEADGLVPFLIDWGDTPHPSATSAKGCRLITFRAEHPRPAAVLPLLEAIGERLEVREGPHARLVAEVASPRGRVEL
ncbi:MAG: VOC family protein [Dehalococcoidia bacterium]